MAALLDGLRVDSRLCVVSVSGSRGASRRRSDGCNLLVVSAYTPVVVDGSVVAWPSTTLDLLRIYVARHSKFQGHDCQSSFKLTTTVSDYIRSCALKMHAKIQQIRITLINTCELNCNIHSVGQVLQSSPLLCFWSKLKSPSHHIPCIFSFPLTNFTLLLF